MNQSSCKRHGCRCLFCILLLAISGCGNDSRRQQLEGTVKLDGEPLAEGSIMFIPQSGTSGPSAGGPIKEGRFSIESERGTFAGKFLVRVTATHKTGRKIRDPDSGVMIDEEVEIIPARYNRQSELTVDVQENEMKPFDFLLRSK